MERCVDPRYLLRWVLLFAGMPTASPVHRDFARAFEKEIAAEDHRQMVTR
jgi:hypothetical protein